MDGNEEILLTAQQVREWREKKAQLEVQIADAEVDLAVLNQRLEAVSIITAEKRPDDDPVLSKDGDDTSSDNMIAAIERIAKLSREPLTKAQTKDFLRQEGFKSESLGNYFYTCIKRLKDRQRIHVLPDGKITKPAMSLLLAVESGNAG